MRQQRAKRQVADGLEEKKLVLGGQVCELGIWLLTKNAGDFFPNFFSSLEEKKIHWYKPAYGGDVGLSVRAVSSSQKGSSLAPAPETASTHRWNCWSITRAHRIEHSLAYLEFHGDCDRTSSTNNNPMFVRVVVLGLLTLE